jgi:uncharacterized SAM-binding protein YcdF (DUF218 family)
MRKLFNVIFQLVAAALVIFLFTAVWIVFDGLTDLGQKADVALVTDMNGLDRAIKLYNEDEFPFIIVSGSMVRLTTVVNDGTLRLTGSSTDDEAADMAKYLESHGVPSSAIIEDHLGENTVETADNVAEIMKTTRDVAEIVKSHRFQSVMVVTDYYCVTLTKLALHHEGVPEIQKAHVGKLRKADAWKIGREVVALYAYIGKFYLLPEVEKLKKEALAGLDRVKADAEKAREKVDKSLDSLSK